MELKDVQKKEHPERKTKSITIRTFPSNCKWMAKYKISPTSLFNKALEELKKKTKD